MYICIYACLHVVSLTCMHVLSLSLSHTPTPQHTRCSCTCNYMRLYWNLEVVGPFGETVVLTEIYKFHLNLEGFPVF